MSRDYSNLADFLREESGEQQPLSVCIVTPDMLGPVKNGGIGTACTFLAYALARARHKVHILFTQVGVKVEKKPVWKADYANRGISVTVAENWSQQRDCFYAQQPFFPNHPPLRMAAIVYEWLKVQPAFDLVIFMEWQGHGFYALHARNCGLAFQQTAFVVVAHSPSLWHSLNNASYPEPPSQACTWHMERFSIENADAVLSPSKYMLDWCKSLGWQMPSRCYVQPNLLEVEDGPTEGIAPVREFVFFGRLEYRKGLVQFCDALDELARRRRLPSSVSFFGKCAWMGKEHSAEYLARRSQKWRDCTIALHIDASQKEALAYLAEPGRLAVMPSVADNSPYTVYECLASGIPFLARNVGGVEELIAPKDRTAVLFDDNPYHLADKLQTVLDQIPQRAHLAFDRQVNEHDWAQGLPVLVAQIANDRYGRKVSKELPLISVCLTHHDRPKLLKQAVQSLLGQTYKHFEIILADDGSIEPASQSLLNEFEPEFRRRGWQILRLEHGFVGRARNIGASHAHGDWLLFFDDDNVAKPEMLQTFAKAAVQSTASCIVTSFEIFESLGGPRKNNVTERFLPLGAIVAYSALQNTIGDVCSLMRKDVFQKLGGFTTDYGVGHEDFELLLRLVLMDEPVAIIPEQLFWYRRVKGKSSVQLSTNAQANRLRSLRPFLGAVAPWQVEGALLASNMYEHMVDCEHRLQEIPHTAPLMPSDPQSVQELSNAVERLLSKGEKNISGQLIDCLFTQGSTQPVTSALVQNLVKLARLTHLQKLAEALQEYESRQPSSEDLHTAYVQVLQALPVRESTQDARASIVHKYLPLVQDILKDTAFAARQCVLAGLAAEAIPFASRAFILADEAYLHMRNDVATAVSQGAFFSGFHHYVIHGFAERTPWPYKTVFQYLSLKVENFQDNMCVVLHKRLTNVSESLLSKTILAFVTLLHERIGDGAN